MLGTETRFEDDRGVLIQEQVECLDMSEAHVVDVSLVAVALVEWFAQVGRQYARIGMYDPEVPRQVVRVDTYPADKTVQHVGFDIPLDLRGHAPRPERERIQLFAGWP
jgi:hypothetical protein